MNKLILAFAGAMALSFAANAVVIGYASNDEWFNGGIEDGWPEKATGGGWSNTNGTTYANNKLTVSATTDPLTFTAAVEKVTANYKATISSEVGFTAFDTMPEVPAEAKAGVIAFTNGTFWALAKGDGDFNVWQNTLIETNAEVKIDVTFLETNKVVYVIGDKAVTNTVKAVESVSKVCASGDGTLANLVATAEARVTPVDPTKPTEYDTPEAAQAAAEAINNNKFTMIAKPFEEMTDAQKSAYDGYVQAAANGKIVTIVFNDAGAAAAQESVDEAVKNTDILDTTKTDVTVSAIPGFFYEVLGADILPTFDLTGGQTQATGNEVTLKKPTFTQTNQGFYKVEISIQAKQK